MSDQKLKKQVLIKCLLSYRILFAYFMGCALIFTHFLVTSSRFESLESIEKKREIDPSRSFNSKRLLNFEASYDILSSRQGKQKRAVRSQWHRSIRKSNNLVLERLIAKRVVVSKLVIDPPSDFTYNLKNSSTKFYSQILQDQILSSLLNKTELIDKPGLFVEAGAFDGETWSNTLHLERFLNWSGLLIEPSEENYRLLRSKNRHAFSINSCLCGGNTSLKSNFIEAGPFGVLSQSSQPTNGDFKLTCHPLAFILDEFFKLRGWNQASQVRVIDYLSLDIEGNERSIVETFPWDRYRFNFINIEFNQAIEQYTWLKNFLKQFGYVETVKDDVWFQDLYLAHESIAKRSNFDRVYKVSEFLNSRL